MYRKQTTLRLFSILVLLGLVIAQLGAVHPAQAAAEATTKPILGMTVSPTQVLPNQQVTISLDETFGSYSGKGNVVIDTKISLTPRTAANFGGLVVTAYVSTSPTPVGMITLASGQTWFWVSSFGGALSRHSAKSESNKSHTYRFVFTPGYTLAGRTIDISSQILMGDSKAFNNRNSWTITSDVVPGSITINSLPVMEAPKIGGPYTTGIPYEFQINVYNFGGANYPTAQLSYSIGKDTSSNPIVEPDVQSIQFSLDNGTSWKDATKNTVNGVVSGNIAAPGFALAPGASAVISVKIIFNNDSSLFPFKLQLTDPQTAQTLDTLDAFAAVKPSAAELVSGDLGNLSNPPTNYRAGIPQKFHVAAINPENGASNYKNLSLKFTVQSINVQDILIEYYIPASDAWQTLDKAQNGTSSVLTYNGIENFSNPSVLTFTYRVTFERPGTYPITVALAKNGTEISAVTPVNAIANVLAVPPVLDLSEVVNQTPFIINNPDLTPFTVRAVNPSTGDNYDAVRLNFTLTNATTDDLTFEYSPSSNTWYAAQMTQQGSDITGFIPQERSFASSITLATLLRINFSKMGTHVLTFTLVRMPSGETITTQSVYLDALPAEIPVTGGAILFLPMVRS